MVDPSKATKGRRMSKKTRKKTHKKSTKAAAGKPARVASKTSAKAPAAKKSPTTAGKPITAASKRSASAKPKSPVAKPKSAHKAALNTPVISKGRKTAPTAPSKATAASSGTHAALAEGAKAPSFRLPRDGGETVSLADFAGQKLVLFFYPRADTPGCTREAIDFTRLAKSFAESQTAVVGVSADPPKTQESFRTKHQLTTPLASDEKHEMLAAYGAWGEKSMYGRTFLGVLRTTVLVDADGRVMKIWRHVKVDGHADEVLAKVQSS
jgi:peroxiredoxin Q/BCP